MPRPDKPVHHREVATTREPAAPPVPQSPAQRPATNDSTVEVPGRSAAEAPRAAPVPVPVPAAQPAAGESVRTSPPVVDDVGADGMRQYRISLAAQAKRFKLYPARAMEAGMTGTAEVRVTIGPTGFPLEVQLAKSSGYELLDRTAMDMIRKAAPRTAIPEALRGRTFTVGLPVVFDLAE